MKKRYRLLCMLLIALLALPSIVSAEYYDVVDDDDEGTDTGMSVYIPNKIARLHVPDMPEYIALRTRTESVATYGNPDDPNDPCPILPVSEPDIELFFSEQPDWAAVLWTEGPEYITVSERGYAKVSSAGHSAQPGTTPGTMLVEDETTGEKKRVWATTTADHQAGDAAPSEEGAFMAGKDNVTVLYNRNGTPVWVEFAIDEDFYKTGMDGAVTTFRYERVIVDGDFYVYDRDEEGNYIYEATNRVAPKIIYEDGKYRYARDDDGDYIYEPVMEKKRINLKGNVLYLEEEDEYVDITHLFDDESYYRVIQPGSSTVTDEDGFVHWYYTTWYISQVVATYPEDGNLIVRVESDWRNDSGQFLWGYKITYATSANERYKITYAPNTTTIFEDHNSNTFEAWDDPTYPSTDLEAFFSALEDEDASLFHGMYLHHYEEDQPIYGEYTDGTVNLVSGSGDYLPYWFEEGHGARARRFNLWPCTSFQSPRYK